MKNDPIFPFEYNVLQKEPVKKLGIRRNLLNSWRTMTGSSMRNTTQAHLSDQSDSAHLPALPSLPDPLWEQVSRAHISRLSTAPMPALSPAKDIWQQDLFHSWNAGDIASQMTFKIPVIRATPDAQPQDLASTAAGAAVAGAGDLAFAVLRYVTNVVMTNIVSESVYGTYMSVYTPVLIAGSIAQLGLYSTMVRFLPAYRMKGERGLAAGLIRFVIWMTFISGLLCGALFYLSSTVIAHLVYHQDAYALPLKEIALLIPLIALQLVLASGLQALKAIKWKVYVDRLIQPGLTLAFIGAFYLLGLRLEALILATICGFLASVITGHILLRKASRHLVSDVRPRFEPKTWLRFALPMSLYTLIQNVMNSTDVLFLTAFTTAAQVGLYAAADRVSTFVLMPLYALNTIFSPLIAEYYARGDYEQLANLAKVVTKWSFSLTLPIFLCFYVFHDAVLSIFSREYTAAGAVLIILSFGNLVNAIAGLAGSLLLITGHSRIILVDTAATIIVNIGLAFFLVPRFNVTGAAVAAALAVIILNIAYFIQAYLILKMLTFRWDMLKSVAAAGVASMAGFLLLHVIPTGYGYHAIFGTCGLVITFILVYALVLALLRFSKEDIMVFDAVLARVGRKRQV